MAARSVAPGTIPRKLQLLGGSGFGKSRDRLVLAQSPLPLTQMDDRSDMDLGSDSPASDPRPQEVAAEPKCAHLIRRAWSATGGWMQTRPKAVTRLTALFLYVLTTAVFFVFASEAILTEHTDFNHFALLADAWLNGRLHLEGDPPAYAQFNDFAKYHGRWYVAFPPFPAVLLLPFAAIAGEPSLVRDGQFFVWLAGVGPAVLFLALERLRDVGQLTRSRVQNALLSMCLAFGSVYFFTAVQGTVWFAAHVVGLALAALYLLASIGARHPVLAGFAIGCAVLTRPPLLFAVPLFALQALHVCTSVPRETAASGSWVRRRLASATARCASVDWRRLLKLYVLFAIPIVLCLGVTFWLNEARFDHPLNTGYQYLTVAWKARMQKWGLFHYHYLSRNLGVALSMLPWIGTEVPFRINVHGLALWFTTPLYLWVVWPKRTGALHWALWVTVGCVAVPTLFYQNTGWAQFGYRFSNDYSVFLFALLALGGRPMRLWFGAAAIWSVGINAFGAWTFGREEYKDYYYIDGSQKSFYQRD